jgi:hemoglobin-like flavoprotein
LHVDLEQTDEKITNWRSQVLAARRERVMEIDEREIMLAKSTFAMVHTVADLTARFFYERLFELSPEARMLFTGNMQNQRGKFMATLSFIVESLDQPQTLRATTLRLGREHARYGTLDEHYAVVGDALLWALEQSLGPAYTPEVDRTWAKIYSLLAKLMKEGARDGG